METRININYTPSKTSEVFGLFTLSFQGSDGKVHSVDTKFNPKQLWEFSRDTSSVAFDLLVLSGQRIFLVGKLSFKRIA